MKRNKSDTGKEARYIKVPLPMFRLLIQDKWKIKDVIDYGVYLTAMSQECSKENAMLQLVYAYQNRNSESGVPLTPTLLRDWLHELDEEVGITADEDNRGFYGEYCYQPFCEDGEYAPDYIRGWCEEYPEFAEQVMEYHKLRQAAALLNLNRMSAESLIKVHEKYKRFDNDVFAYANIDIMQKYLSAHDQKSNDDMACLLMYLAYKSIIGEKKIVRASNSMVLARMVGAKGRDELEGILAKHPHAKKFYERYSQKEHFNRIKGMVSKYKFIPRINSIPGKAGLGTFVSCDHNISNKEFAENIKKLVDDERKKKNRERVARYRAKYNQDNDDTSKYLAEMFGTSSNDDEPPEEPSYLPI